MPGDRRAAATATAAAATAVRHQQKPRSLLKAMPIKGYRGSGALLRIDISNTTTRWRFMVTQPRCKPGLVLGGSAAHHASRCPPSSQASMSSNETEPAVQVVRAFQVSIQPVLGHTRSCGDHRDSGGLAMCRESERLRGDVRIHPPVMHLCAHRYNNCIRRLHRQPLLTAMSLPSSLAGFPRFPAFLARFPASNWILRIDCQSRSSYSFGCWTGRGWSVDGGTTRVAGGVSSCRTRPRRCGVGTATGAALPRTEPTASADAGSSADARESRYSYTTPVCTATLPRLRRRLRHAAWPPARRSHCCHRCFRRLFQSPSRRRAGMQCRLVHDMTQTVTRER